MKVQKYPDVIYKFRNWLNPLHRDILFKNEIYLSAPKDFNDPFDCRIPYSLYLLDDDEKKKKYLSRIINNNREHFPQDKTLEELLSVYIKPYIDDLKLKQRENEISLYEQQDKRYGIISFGTNWNNNLMWAHYANSHSGFCVGFKEPNIRNEKFGGWGGRVNYTDVFPIIDPNEEYLTDEDYMKSVFLETHTKEKRWRYEKEYRVARIFEKDVTKKERIIQIDNSAYHSITLGLWFPESEIQFILNIAQEKQIPVYKIKQKQLSFKLNRIKIN